MGLISKRMSSLIGVDIGSTSVKLLQLARVGSQLHVDHYAIEPLPPNAVADNQLLQIEAVGEAIRRALVRSGAKRRLAVAAVAGSDVITKTISMPAGLDEEELEALVELEAANHIPYPLEEVNMDFEVLGPLPDDASIVRVLLVASRTENIEQRRLALEQAGLVVKIIDVEIFAAEKALSLFAADQTLHAGASIALIDVGEMSMTLNVMSEGRSIYHRGQPFSGKQLNGGMARVDDVFSEIAANADNSQESEVGQILESFQVRAVLQIHRLLQLFYASSQWSQINQIILTGDGVILHGLPERIETQLAIPAAIANPLGHIRPGPTVPARVLGRDASALMIATGLALRSWD